jgi:hypothetical protein
MSDQHVIFDSVNASANALQALAAHLGLILDPDGHTVIPPDGADLVEVVTHLLHARHRRDSIDRWDQAGDPGRVWWLTIATEAILDAPAVTIPDLAAHLHRRLDGRAPWTSLDRGGRAPWTITAQHIARLVQEAGA